MTGNRVRRILASISETSRSDEGDSTVITTVIVFPFLWMLGVTMVEIPVFFENRNQLQNDLHEGAHAAAILGGVNTQASSLAATYGAANACQGMDRNTVNMLKQGWKPTDAVTCNTARQLNSGASYIAFNVYDLECGPAATEKVMSPTWCEARYAYSGMPGGAMSLIGGTQAFGRGLSLKTTDDGYGKQGTGIQYGKIRMSAQSEVCMTGACSANDSN